MIRMNQAYNHATNLNIKKLLLSYYKINHEEPLLFMQISHLYGAPRFYFITNIRWFQPALILLGTTLKSTFFRWLRPQQNYEEH